MSRYAETYAAWQNDPVGFWQELATRIDDAAPKVVISASCDLAPRHDVEYAQAVEAALAKGEGTECVPVDATDPLYIL